MSLLFLVAAVFVGFMLIAAFYDLFTMTIPNELNGAVAILFILIACISGYSALEIATNISLGVLVLLIGFTLFAFGLIQGGDAKLAAAVAAWMGFEHILMWFVYMSLIGGGLTLILLAVRQITLPVFLLKYEWIDRLHRPTTGVPYGIAIAAAAIVVYPETDLFRRLVQSFVS